MTVKLGINGFGRIGRLVLRAALETDGVEVVGLNDLASNDALALLFKYDSTHGPFKGEVSASAEGITINGKLIPVSEEKDPANLPWAKLGAQVVCESTGFFSKKADAAKHITAGAKKVIISQPSPDADKMIVMGVNDKEYDPASHDVVSNASCTTNSLAPAVKVLNDNFGVEHGLMTTVHSYTNDQRILDQIHKDPRRARAGAVNIIPTKTGAAAAIGKVIPALNGKLDGYALRVPTPNVSATDFTVQLSKDASAADVNAALKAAAEGELKGIMGYSEEPLVSSDYNHCPLSSIVDSLSTKAMAGGFVKLLLWYDNEWGYSCRCIDLAKLMAKSL
ncbi:type I glyceraldehyde-3-phosphate dehydrogenase [Candidatus Sumerlaeota bacterium]|nr:type I glyceraldehyde-3-phosphate dehydrogenase [Candidatus Sumerlaeota bacterium]